MKKELTRAELEVMQILWTQKDLFLSEIIKKVPEPRPAYTTISTIIRILVKKGFVVYKAYGKSFCYNTTISKEEYAAEVMQRVKMNFFGGSVAHMLSFFAKKETLSDSERQELKSLMEGE